MSRSHLHWSPHPTGEGGRLAHAFVASIFPSSVFLSVCFLTYAHSTVSLSFFVSFISYAPYIFLCLLSLHYNPLCQSVDLLLSTHSLSIFICGCFLLFCLFVFHYHSFRIPFSLLFTHSFSMHLLWLHLYLFLFLSLSIR